MLDEQLQSGYGHFRFIGFRLVRNTDAWYRGLLVMNHQRMFSRRIVLLRIGVSRFDSDSIGLI